MRRRALLLFLSVLVAAAGTGLIYAYVRNADDRAIGDQQPVKVVVARAEIPIGTSAADAVQKSLVVLQTRPRGAVGDDTFVGQAGLESLRALGSRSAAFTISAKTQVQRTFFVGSTAAVPGAGSKDVSVVLSMEGAASAPGLISSGGSAMVLVTIKGTRPVTKVLIASAHVISVNGLAATTRTSTRSAPEGSQATVGLSVPLKDAEKVILANSYKDRYELYVVRPGDEPPGLQQATLPDLAG